MKKTSRLRCGEVDWRRVWKREEWCRRRFRECSWRFMSDDNRHLWRLDRRFSCGHVWQTELISFDGMRKRSLSI